MIPETYIAGIFHGKENIELREVPMPEVGDNDILVKTLYASCCGSEIGVYKHGLRGERIVPGKDFGHEGVVQVVKVGKNVENINVGDRLAPYPINVLHDPARRGAYGSFSQYILFPDCALGKTVLKVPDGVASDVAAMVEPFSVAMKAAKTAHVKLGERGVVFGSGTIGVACALWLKHCGAEVIMVDHNDFRLEIAKKVGGFETFNSKTGDLAEYLMEKYGTCYKPQGYYSNGKGVKDIDFYVDCCGRSSEDKPDVIKQFMELARNGSRLVICGKHSIGPEPADYLLLSQNSVQLLGSGGYSWQDMEDVLAFFESKEFDFAGIITHKFEQKDLAKALTQGQNTSECLKIEIKYVDD